MENKFKMEDLEQQIREHTEKLWGRILPDYRKTINKELKESEKKNVDEFEFAKRKMDKTIDKIFGEMADGISGADELNKPSKIIKKNWQNVLDAYVPKEKQEEALYIIDKQTKFFYSLAHNYMYRRTVRSKQYLTVGFSMLKSIFEGYYNMTFYAEDIEGYYSSENSQKRMEIREFLWEYNTLTGYGMDNLIAAELDMGNTNLAQLIEDILMSENNTNIVTTALIRGIVKSDNSHLHKILGDFLLAARLQEGVRQAVCENMDSGTMEGFMACFDVIVENDLIRYSSVKRAVSTWTGIFDYENAERISNKQLEIMNRALHESEYIQELLKSNDSVELYLGLWAQGFYEVTDAIESCKKLIDEGTKNQKLVVSYYNRAVQNWRFSMETSTKVLEKYPHDIELCAAFMPTYMPDRENVLFKALFGPGKHYGGGEYVYDAIPVDTYFDNEEQARKHFGILKELKDSIPKKGRVFSPCIFPWYSVEISPSYITGCMCIIAYMLEDDELIDEVSGLLSDISEIYERMRFLRLLLHEPKTEKQRTALLQALSNKASDIREEAYKILSNMELAKNDYVLIRSFLKYKASDMRKYVLTLLYKQNDRDLVESIEVLLSDKKEEMRLGGLDLVVRLKKDDKRQPLFEKCRPFIEDMNKTTEKENIIISELTGDSKADSVLSEKGYGLYNPDAKLDIPKFKGNKKYINKFFCKKKKEMYALLDKLEVIYTENEDREYKTHYGEEHLLGNSFVRAMYKDDAGMDEIDKYPFPELWRGFYEKHVKDFTTLVNLMVFMIGSGMSSYYHYTYAYEIEKKSRFRPLAVKIYGKDYIDTDLSTYKHGSQMINVVESLYFTYKEESVNKEIMSELVSSMMEMLLNEPMKMSMYAYTDGNKREQRYYALDTVWFKIFRNDAKEWHDNEEFERMFIMCQYINNFYGENALNLTFIDYVKAYTMNLISLDNVYQAAFNFVGLTDTFEQMSPLLNNSNTRMGDLSIFIDSDGDISNNKVFQTALKVYKEITEMILKVELNRSEVPTKFSYVICKMPRVEGIAHLLDILKALGDDKLNRSVYYSYYGNVTDKRTCLCHLLHVCVPLPKEDGKTLKKMLKGRNISDKRLVETAMYNPEWIDIVEECLGWQGFKSGVYYFTAHMNESFSARTEAMIAKYTPLTEEELNDGAFDLNWFLECSKKLGEKRFGVLYDSAKYISDSNKHTRARKYADAVQGKVSAEELEKKIGDKRNKDLLMSYPLLPIKNEKEVLDRYRFLQKYLKESKQFGAQRRASEARAVSMGMQNLAMRSGYSDVTRLTLNMETELVKQLKPYFEWKEIDDIKIKIIIGDDGKPSVSCEKNTKLLKSIPAKLKKNPYVIEIKDVCKQLKDQYMRTKKMMEEFMEDGVCFTAKEMAKLQENPVIMPIIKDLVFVCKEDAGFLNGMVLIKENGDTVKLTPKKSLKIAHPFDLWSMGIWQSFQKILFDKKVKQPFKQVFRELYVKTKEEMDKQNSLRYAGNQIQPRKTVGCLRGRNWVADYEDGLQKVYYKENIVARIYAIADWFSPSDIEAPTLEWVEFSDRKTFKPICIKDVPDRIFSEVMRDVDLAVSVAHAGGVDPETSHSTMEMRRAIVEYNLPLFGLTNVTFSGNHAVIEGERASYTIHLGSGVIFKKGGAQIAVLPVHSQHRGKLFLPFVDEDPKTAEIMSKIVLFAEDMKIKDPYILEQLNG